MATTTPTIAVADIYTKVTELDVFIPELWTDSIRATFKKSLKLAALSNDYSSVLQAAGGGDKIHIPTYADVADALAKGSGLQVDYAAPTEVEMYIDVATHMYTSAMIEDLAVVQANQDIFAGYIDSLAYKLALDFDTKLIAQLNTTLTGILIGAQATVADTTETIGKNSMHDIWNQVSAEGVDPSECILVLGNKLYSSLFLLDDFIHTSKTGVSNFGSAQVGTLMGMPVVHSTGITGAVAVAAALVQKKAGSEVAVDNDEVIGGFVVHKSALGHAYAKAPTVVSQYDMDYIAHKMVADTVYGVKLLETASVQRKSWALIETGVTAF